MSAGDRGAALLAASVFGLALVLYAQGGAQGSLMRDDSIFAYSGQQFADGIPPYLSTFHAKTPLAAMLAGVGVAAARVVGADDLLGARVLFLLLSAATAAAIALLAAALLRSRAAGLVAGLLFVGCWGFGFHALGGPRPKAPMVLFETLALLLAVRRRWLSAGVCGSLASLVWQPAGLFVASVLALAGLQSEPGAARHRALRRAVLGAGLPWLALLVYLAATGALVAFVEDAFLFHVLYLERSQGGVLGRVAAAWAALEVGYHSVRPALVLGFLGVLAAYPWRLRRAHVPRAGGRFLHLLRTDAFAGVLVSFPLAVAWCLTDFQSYPDHYLLLPYLTVGFAGLVHVALEAATTRVPGPGVGRLSWPTLARGAVVGLLCAALVAGAARDYRHTRNSGLVRQRQWAEHLDRLAGPQGTVVSLGVPQALVLTGRRNPNPYVFLCCGIDEMVGARSEGGFEGWLGDLVASGAEVIVLEGPRGPVARALAPVAVGYRTLRVGDWFAFVRPAAQAPPRP